MTDNIWDFGMNTEFIEKIVLRLTDGSNIRGKVYIDGYNRLSDWFRKEEGVLTVFDATAKGFDNQTLFINKDNVLFISPLEDVKTSN